MTRFYPLTAVLVCLIMLVAACAKAEISVLPAPASETAAPAPASIAELIEAVDIPYETFTLGNGLRVIVHQDRKAPVVAVSVWYRVGSKHEPKGQTGFAHLFEHLMFNGSENAPGDFFEPLQQVGATDFNGTTNVDRTNYFETVPTGALDRALFLESDRMGHLLGAVTQEKLDNQRGVVQNEKRQGDNNPYGLLRYEIFENLFPSGHPYHHSTIGSMADLDAASLDDTRKWFRDNYGPNNAVLVLAGDIDVATAKAKVGEWFGDIPRGSNVRKVVGDIPTLPAPLAKKVYDLIPTTRLYRMWAIPGLNDPEAASLQIAATVLGGLSGSRLDNALVRKDPVAVSVAAFAQNYEDAGFFIVQADVKPGADPEAVGKRLDQEIAAFLESGPSEDELQRTAASTLSGLISGLESVGGFGGKAVVLAEGALYSNNPGYYKTELQRMAEATPQQIRDVARKWLRRPTFSLTYAPGERTEGGENRGGAVLDRPAGSVGSVGSVSSNASNVAANAKTSAKTDAKTSAKTSGAVAADAYWNPALSGGDYRTMPGRPGAAVLGVPGYAPDRSQLPAVAELTGLDFPEISRTRISNGMEVIFVRRDTVPMVRIAVSFDAGYAADPKDALGTQSLMLRLMNEGTMTLDSIAFAEAKERLGASITSRANADDTVFTLTALKPNLAASLDLLADFVRNPAFDAKELERVRTQQLNRINAELNNPNGLALRTLAPIIYGSNHPYGIPPSGLGDPAAVSAASREQLVAFHKGWIRSDNVRIFVVGDTSLEEVTKLLEKSFGTWKRSGTRREGKDFSMSLPIPQPRIILIDRPKSPQSVIYAAKVLDVKGSDALETLRAGNEIFGGSFLSRINSNLRETKGWSYGVRSRITSSQQNVAFVIAAPVQADKTGASIKELRSDLTAFLQDRGVSDEELIRTVNGNVRELPGSFETIGDIMNGVENIVIYGRKADYYETLADIYRSMSAAEIDAAARKVLSVDDLVYVVVGDAEIVKPQLDLLELSVDETLLVQ